MPASGRAGDEWETDRRDATARLLLFAKISFVIVGLAPFVLPLLRAALPLEPLGAILDSTFILVCHRLPERSLDLAGVTMPVCSRCAGIFGGLVLGAVIAWPKLSLKQARLGLLLAALLMVVDVALQDFGVHPLWHSTRLFTGSLLGYIATAALMAAIGRERDHIHARPLREKPKKETS